MAGAFDEFEQSTPKQASPGASTSAFAEFEQPADTPKPAVEPVVTTAASAPGQVGALESAFSAFETPEETSKYDTLRKEMDRGIVESITKSPVVGAKPIEDSEIQTIAQKHGVSPEDLRSWLTFVGGDPGWSNLQWSDVPKGVAGAAGLMALGIPQKLAKKTQTPEMERALDDLQELAARRMSLVGAVAQAAAPIGEVGTAAGLGKKLLTGAAIGGAGGAAMSRQGQELPGATFGAAGGAVLAGAAAGIGKGVKWLRGAPEAEAKVAEQVAQRGGADFQHAVDDAIATRADADQLLRDRLFGGRAEFTPEQAATIAEKYRPGIERPAEELAQDVYRDSVDSLARDVFKRPVAQQDNPEAMLRSWAGQAEHSGQGTQYASERMQGLLDRQTAEQYLTANGIRAVDAPNWLSKKLDWLSDAQYVLRGVDEKWKGVGAEPAHKEIVTGLNRMSFPREEMRGMIGDIFKRNQREGVDTLARDAEQLIEKVESGATLTHEEQKAYEPFQQFFKHAEENINRIAVADGKAPLAIKSRPNYIPVQFADDLTDRVSQRVQNIVDAASEHDGVKYTDIAQVPDTTYRTLLNESPDFRSTVQFMHTISGDAGKTPANISLILKETFLNPESRNKLETIAKAALEREDHVPMWARETDMYKLADKWTTSTLRSVFLREGIDKLRNVAHKLDNIGDTHNAEYVKNLLADIMGVRQGTAAATFNRLQQNYLSYLDKRIAATSNPVMQGSLTALKAIPSVFQTLSKQIYPNLLGAANPRTLVMNLTQPITKTFPELGPKYGTATVLRGAMRIGGVSKMPGYIRRMEEMGLAPNKFMGGSLNYLAEGFARGDIVQKPAAFLRGLAEIGMKPYEIAESFNRGITFATAETMAHDLMHGTGGMQKLAFGALENFPTTVSRAAKDAIAAGDQTALTKELATHLINNTQYQYNRASMSEYGRTMGPMFSAFSKWPTATLGQVVESMRSKGLAGGGLEVAKQLVAPFALLELADTIMGQHRDDGLSPRQAKFVSKSGLSQAAPIGNLGGIITGDFFTPPVVDTALQAFIHPLNQKDSQRSVDGFKKAMANGLYMFAPGGIGGWVRFVTDDLSTMVTGEKPEGSNFLEKTESGWQNLKRGLK